MPKKSPTKVDPEKLKEMFEQWKLSKEAKLWDELLEMIKENKDAENKDAESIEDDFTLHFKPFLFKLQQLCDELKVPKRPKSIFLLINKALLEPMEQEVLRTFYFQNRNPIHTCNGQKGEFDREIVQDSLSMRSLFVELIIIIKKKSEINETEYQSKLHFSAVLTKMIRNQERTGTEMHTDEYRIH